jgi:hypothetical protein
MATVRKFGRTVQPAGVPSVRRNAARSAIAEGAGLAEAQARTYEAVASAGNAVARIGIQKYTEITDTERKRANEVARLSWSNKLDAWELNRIHDPEKGALVLRGEQAFTLPEEVDREFNELAGQIEQSLGNDEQRLAFARDVSQRGTSVALTVRRHVAGEIREFDAKQLEATVASTASLAAANALSPKVAGEHMARGVEAIQTYGKRSGMPADAIAAQVAAYQSGTHIGIINNLLSHDQERAAEVYFAAAEEAGQIAGDKVDDVRKAIKVGSIRRQSQEVSDEIVTAGGTRAEQLAKAREIEDSDLRDAVTQRIKVRADEAEEDARAAAEDTSRVVYDILDRTKDVTKIPPGVWSQMTGDQRSRARNYAESLVQRPAGTASIKTDQRVFYMLSRMATEDPEAFAKVNLYDLAKSKLSDSDFQQVTGWQMSRRTGKPDAALDNVFTTTQIFDRTAKAAKFATDTTEGQALFSRFTQDVEREQRATGKKLSSTDQQAILDRLLISQTTGGDDWIPFNEKTKRGYEMTIDDIPASSRRALVAELESQRIDPSEANILEAYLRHLAKAKK